MVKKWILHVVITVLLLLSSVCGIAHAAASGQPVRPQLRSLLAADKALSERDRALYSYVIDYYVPECPGKHFGFTRLSDAIKVEDPQNGSFIVVIHVVCDDKKNEPDKVFIGERLALDSKFSVRTHMDIYRPTGELAEKLELAWANKEREKLAAPPEPGEDELRKQQADDLLALLDGSRNVNNEKRAIYRALVPHLPLCSEDDRESFKTIRDAVWLSGFNEGYLAVSLLVCDWNDLDAYIVDKKGNLKGKFNLPAGKYGLGPPHEFKVGNYTGDSKQEFYYRKVFPTSSVPAFMASVQLYKVKAGESVPRLILDMEVESQDCFEGTQSKPGIGSRTTADLKFIPEKGLINIVEQESSIACSDFSWGEKPVRTVKTSGKKTKILRWDPSRFSYVPVNN